MMNMMTMAATTGATNTRRRVIAGTSGGGAGSHWTGTTRNAESASYAHVSAAVAASSPGDIVVVPAGSADWTGDITINGIALIGPGKDAGSPMNITGGSVIVDKHATYKTMIRGFRFTTDGYHMEVTGDGTDQMFFVGDCYFYNDGTYMMDVRANGGLFWDCAFDTGTPHQADNIKFTLGNTAAAASAWAAGPYAGANDTNGDKRVYFEDCTWDGYLEVAGDVDDGARVTYRYCTFTDSSLVVHGGNQGVNDTSAYGGISLEVHNCSFVRVSNSSAINKWVWWRGGSGVFANNAVDFADSPDGFSYPNKTELRMSCACVGTPSYPMTYQVGQTTTAAENPPSFPLLIFGNTGDGPGDSDYITVDGSAGGGLSCGIPSTYIQTSRDYYTTNAWSWTAFTYPHPQRVGAEA